jgi:hypothetical protein
MKHLLLLVSLVSFTYFGSNAQSCQKAPNAGKSCCAAKKSTDASTSSTDVKSDMLVSEADALVASSNGNITKRTCEMSGTTSYFEKSVCATSGKISWEEVKYDGGTKTFTKVASALMEKDENGTKVQTKSCAGQKDGKACCAKNAAKACAGHKEGSK